MVPKASAHSPASQSRFHSIVFHGPRIALRLTRTPESWLIGRGSLPERPSEIVSATILLPIALDPLAYACCPFLLYDAPSPCAPSSCSPWRSPAPLRPRTPTTRPRTTISRPPVCLGPRLLARRRRVSSRRSIRTRTSSCVVALKIFADPAARLVPVRPGAALLADSVASSSPSPAARRPRIGRSRALSPRFNP